jgi:hypothetical protein
LTTNLSYSDAAIQTHPGGSYNITQDASPYSWITNYDDYLYFTGNTTLVSDNVTGSTQDLIATGHTVTIDQAQFDGGNGNLSAQTIKNDGNFGVVRGYAEITAATINGTGTYSMADGGFLYLTGSVGANLSFDIGGGGSLVINNPSQFHGTITAEDDDDSFQAILAGVKATSYSYANDTLTLYNGNKVADAVKLNYDMQNGPFVSSYSGGILIDSYTPSGYTALPTHTPTA